MNFTNSTFLLRVVVSIILLTHRLLSTYTGDVGDYWRGDTTVCFAF